MKLGETRFAALRDDGTEGYTVVGGGDRIRDAVEAREDAIAHQGGGRIAVVEVVPTLEAYRRADYEKPEVKG